MEGRALVITSLSLIYRSPMVLLDMTFFLTCVALPRLRDPGHRRWQCNTHAGCQGARQEHCIQEPNGFGRH